MKKIFAWALAAVCLLGVASCGDDDDYKAVQSSSIKVLSAETSLQSRPDTGSVVVDCEPVQAYVDVEDASWIDVQVKGDSVKFFAKQNPSTESRNTRLTIKKSENDSITMNIDQLGMIFIVDNKIDIMQVNDNAKSYYFNVRSDFQGEVISTPDWVTAGFSGSRLNISFAENQEGHLREGYITYGCGNFRDSLKVTQYDFEKDILGDYELWVGYDPKTDLCEGKIDVKLTANTNGAVTLNFTALYGTVSLPIQIPVSFDQDSLSISIASGQRVASYKDKRNKWTYFYTMFSSPTGSILPALDAAGDTIMQNTSGKITAYLSYEKKKGTYGGFSGLAYNEGGYSAEFKSMYIGAFTSSTPYKKNLVDNKWWFSISDLMLVKKEK